jgi:ribosomal protein S18 acetylase RimI-like enzyme
VADSQTGFRVEALPEDEWSRLKKIRLAALKDDPSAFLSSHEREAAYEDEKWLDEFSRGNWYVMLAGTKDVGLLGVTRESAMSSQECYLEYLWVDRVFRGGGVGSMLLRTVLERLENSGVHTVWLYILTGNQEAKRLYQRFGFQSTNEQHPLPDHPAGSEERMRLRLGNRRSS